MRTKVFRGAAGLVACICFCWAISGATADQPKAQSNAISSKSDNSKVRVPAPTNASGEHSFTRAAGAELSAGGGAAAGGVPTPRGGVPGVCGTITVTQNSDPVTVTPGTSVACAAVFTTENAYARCFLASEFPAGGFTINCVDFGVEQNDDATGVPGGSPYDVELHISPIAALGCGGGWAAETPFVGGIQTVTILDPATTANIISVTLTTPVVVPANTDVIVELHAPDRDPAAVPPGDGGAFRVGSNTLPETGLTYLWAPGCGIATYTDTAGIGFPGMHWVVRLDGDPLVGGPGACCMPDGTCVDGQTPAQCGTLGGTWQGSGTLCAATACPTPPPNDQCINAIALTPPATVTEDTGLATADPLALDCGTSQITGGGPGVWYTVTGTGNTMTATTCSLATTYDTQISVYCGTCTCFVCVDGNDDDAACLGPTQSTVSWCTNAGDTYYIYVHGFNATGVFELTVTDSGTPCAGAVACTPPVPVDCVTLGAQQFLEVEACGLDTNGGCNSTPAAFTELGTLFQGTPVTLGGTGFSDSAPGGIRDTDWYRFNTFSPQVIQFVVTAEFPASIILIQLDAINGACLNPAVLLPVNGGLNVAVAPACVTTTVTSDDCLPAGFYVAFVAPDRPSGGLPCGSTCRFGNDYEGTLSALECPQGCCLNNGQCPFPCQDLTVADCQALGGFGLGAGITCTPGACSFGLPLPAPCCKADANQDGQRDGSDIAVFINAIMTGGGGAICGDPVTGGAFCASDINDDGAFDMADVPGFVDNLLNNHFHCVPPLECPVCVPAIPPGSSQETEFCGDDTNGGCNSVTNCPAPPLVCGPPPTSLLEPLPNSPCDPGGVSVCGSLFGFDPDGAGPLPGSRDTDWWGPFTLTTEMEATVTITSNGIPAGTFLIEISDCNNLVVAPGGSAGSSLCTPGTFTGVIAAGTYVIFAGTGTPAVPVTAGFPCSFGDNSYNLTMTCAPAPVGACCDLAQVCIGDLTQSQCLVTVGNQWHSGQSCAAGFVCPPPCPIDCALSLPEGEVCGTDTNGGCNSVPPVFTLGACNRSWCGTISAAAGTRDTDWYEVTLTTTQLLTATLTARVPADVFILGSTPVNNDCAAPNVITFFGTGSSLGDCTTGVAEACLAPGTYWVFVADQQFDFNPCGTPLNDYKIDIACTACPTVPNDRCTQALPIATGVITAGSTTGASTDAPASTCATSGASPDAWYSWTAPATGPTTVTMCFAATTYDGAIEIYDACPVQAGGISLACDDDGCAAFDPGCACCPQGFGCGGVISAFQATAGTTYLIRVTGWNGGQGPFEVEVTQP